MFKYLVTFDADRIHDYIFTTGRLKEIIGGSYIVESFTENDVTNILQKKPHKLIYSAGGAGKVLFEDIDDAIEFENSIKTRYRQRTLTSSLSAAHSEIKGSFGDAADEADRLLRQNKDDKREKWHLTNHPLMEFCNSCGQFPVSGNMDGRDLCLSCINKRREKEKLQDHLGKILLSDWKSGKLSMTEFWGSFLRTLDESWHDWWKNDFSVIDDMDDFRQISSPEGYVGFIYTDGNNMGRYFGSLDKHEHYEAFSNALKEGTRTAIVQALARHLNQTVEGTDKNGKAVHFAPFYPVLLGGDDVIVLTAAHKALDVAVDFCKSFNSCVQDAIRKSASLENGEKQELIKQVKDISTSAGLVLAHSKHPIISMFNRADELLKSAKKLSDRKGGVEGAIDFLVVTTPTLKPLSAIRSDEYTFPGPGGIPKVICTKRPYLTNQLESLINWARELKAKGFPKTKLNAFYSAMFQPDSQATFDALLIRSRLGDEEVQLLNKHYATLCPIAGFPYEETRLSDPDAAKKRSCLTDLVEIYDFVRE